MSSDKLDKYVKNTLQDYESQVDADALWQAVQPPRRRRTIWWWMSGMLLLLVVVGGRLWLSNADSSSTKVIGEKAHTSEALVETQSNATGVTEGEIEGTVKEFTPAEIAQPKQETASATGTSGGRMIKTAEQSSESSSSTVTHLNRVDQNTKAKGTTTSLMTNTASSVAEHDLTPAQETMLVKEQLEPTSDIADHAIDSDTKSSVESPINGANSKSTINEAAGYPENPVSIEKQEFLTAVQALPTLAFSPAQKQLVGERSLRSLADEEAPPRRKLSPWSLQLSAGAYRLNRSFSMNDSLPATQLDFRRQTEQPLEAVNADLSVIYEHPSKFRIRTGIGWTSINTVFELNQVRFQVDTVTGVQAIYLTPGGGDTTFVEGPIAAYQTISYRKKHYNRIQHWDVPLLVGYQWSVGQWQLLLEGGVRFNLSQQVSGELLDPELNRIDLGESDRFRTRLGLSYQGGIGIGYALSPRLSIRVDMNLRYFPKDFTQTNAAIGERYQLLGGQLGIQYRF